MMKAKGFTVTSVLKTSSGALPLALERRSVDSFRGAVIDFKPLGKVPDGFLRKGISGAVVTAEIAGQSVPVAMILRITPTRNVLRTLRFDSIKERYGELRSVVDQDSPESIGISAINYRVLDATYTPVDGNLGAASLQRKDGCWRAQAVKGKRTVDVVLDVEEPGKKITSIAVTQGDNCRSNRVHFWLDQRVGQNASWEYLSVCNQDGQDISTCRVDLSSPRQLRLRFDARSPLSIQSILLK